MASTDTWLDVIESHCEAEPSTSTTGPAAAPLSTVAQYLTAFIKVPTVHKDSPRTYKISNSEQAGDAALTVELCFQASKLRRGAGLEIGVADDVISEQQSAKK